MLTKIKSYTTGIQSCLSTYEWKILWYSFPNYLTHEMKNGRTMVKKGKWGRHIFIEEIKYEFPRCHQLFFYRMQSRQHLFLVRLLVFNPETGKANNSNHIHIKFPSGSGTLTMTNYKTCANNAGTNTGAGIRATLVTLPPCGCCERSQPPKQMLRKKSVQPRG